MQRIEFVKEFREAAHRLNTYAIAGQWMRLAETTPTLTAQEAAAWADLNFLPGEAAPLIAQGVTPDMVAAMEDAETTVDGGPEAHLRAAVLRLAEQGVIIDPELADRLGLDSQRHRSRPCPTTTPEPHELGEFPMSCFSCHMHADA